MGRRNAEADLQLPPGFRFSPTEEELVVHYLGKKVAAKSLPVSITDDVDLYKYDPWQLPEKALFGEEEWYFFTPWDRKYPNGSRPNRAAGSGYWKATGTDKPITAQGGRKRMGIKKALVFYVGKAPKGSKTNWRMHEYRLADLNRPARKKGKSRLDDWALCRVYNKKISAEKLPLQQKETIYEKEMENQPISASIEHSGSEESKPYSDHLCKLEPSTTSYNAVPPRAFSMNSNICFQNSPAAFSGSTLEAPVQNTAFNPMSSSLNHHWANYNSTDLISGLHIESNCSKPSSFSEPISEKGDVQSSFRLQNFSQEQQQSVFNFSLEDLQNPFDWLGQITFSDAYQDYSTSLSSSEYLPSFYPN